MQEIEVSLEEAKEMSRSGKLLVWMGREPVEYIAELLGIDRSRMVALDPRAVSNTESLKGLEGSVFVCYHGRSSMRMVLQLERLGIKAYSMRGGVTSIVGEIF